MTLEHWDQFLGDLCAELTFWCGAPRFPTPAYSVALMCMAAGGTKR
jgi:hypothetical protein